MPSDDNLAIGCDETKANLQSVPFQTNTFWLRCGTLAWLQMLYQPQVVVAVADAGR